MIEIPPQKPLSSLNVLVIDGQSLVHDSIKSALIEIGISNCKSAENAFYALRLCEQTKFDVVLISFDIRSDKDGFNLLEEMRLKGHISKTTMVIFLSADTSMSLVNCVVELQPSDFWVKPLDRKTMEKRFKYLFAIKEKLYKLSYCIDKAEYPTAIYYAERQLKDESLSKYYPMINRLIGECLINLKEYSQAEAFYKKLSERYKYGWVQVNLARSLLKQDKMSEAIALTDALLERDDTRFTTYDALAEYYIEKEDYAKGYEIIQEATKLAPRNLDRNKKSWNLARLNHDKKGQYMATMNMAKFAKNSIHDTPDLNLNVIRAAIDLAGSLNGEEATRLITKTERDLSFFVNEYGHDSQLKEQLAIINARMLNLKSDKKGAEEIIKEHMETSSSNSVEDSLDKVKAFHEMGYWEESIRLLDSIKSKIEGDSFIGQVINEYLDQESKERTDIRYSPKELGEMASSHYKNKRYEPAYELLTQAFVLAPKNPNMALSILKVMVKLIDEVHFDEEQLACLKRCKDLLDSIPLSPNQHKKMDEYLAVIEPLLKSA
ncbi:response regulator [Aliiglaciecola sp. 2_MG-2023]|uniref:response regulator n=1 Tax=unclassified Aliiglaciecola TaxID=2593648 RepID=UPI0026E4791F|nr:MULTISPECIES: response regulator [unclassified Aliiglaciecola]MDO6712697.1 response regulator [Aliiglaciecola sp. 2_MG-2023]MDO6752918.1 response regulator [Aliiglaciecola sp. 1_MG-2023]